MALPQPSPNSDWTVETLRQHVIEILAVQGSVDRERDRRYQDRFEAQTKALDAAFLAQQTAMQTALTAAERAVQAALLAAKEAVVKQETATNQRLGAMNEFRGAVQDILAGAMPRAEGEARLNSIMERLAEANARADESVRVVAASVAALNIRLTENESRSAGHGDSTRNLVTIAGLVLTALAIVVTIVIFRH